MDRFIFKGTREFVNVVDGIIHGDKSYFMFYSSKEIIKILEHHLNKNSTGVHISCLFISPFTRCLNKNPKYSSTRNNIQVKWYNIFDDYMLMEMNEFINK